jgi:hypothetical protein
MCVGSLVEFVAPFMGKRLELAGGLRSPSVDRFDDGWDVGGPVQAEVFVVWRNESQLELTGPCGAAPWYLELGDTDHPVDVVTRIVTDAIGPPRLVHSTSWRRDRTSVILSFVVVIEPDQVQAMSTTPIARAELARSAAVSAPTNIAQTQVVEHGLRHLAWLVHDDAIVRDELDATWIDLLRAYHPEPFRNLG